MVKPILTRCGYRCDLCLAYKANIKSSADQQKLSDGWFKYFGFRIPPEKISCDGCLNDGELIDQSCPVRPCAIEHEVEHCGHCENFVCEKLRERIVDGQQMILEHKGISKEDYRDFILPYVGLERIKERRD